METLITEIARVKKKVNKVIQLTMTIIYTKGKCILNQPIVSYEHLTCKNPKRIYISQPRLVSEKTRSLLLCNAVKILLTSGCDTDSTVLFTPETADLCAAKDPSYPFLDLRALT